MRSLLAGATALALILPAAGPAVAAAPTVTRAYAASAEVFANPGRGFFTYTETHLFADGSGWVPLDAAALAEARTGQGRSLVFRIFYLERYRGTDTVAAADLERIRADFAAIRRAGVKAVVRFAYSADSGADATPDRTVRHIAQLGPILAANADVLTAVQAGFVGRWGEWYYTDNYVRADRADRRRVLTALLAAVPAGVPVQVRTPAIARALAPGDTRVGVHNDCFLAGTDDYGTYTAADDRQWLAARKSLVGGETCDVSDRSGWADASTEMAAYHWTYLNPSFHLGVLNSWGEDGLAEAGRRLGYRIRLVQAVLPARAEPGAKIKVTVKVTNDGYAAPVQNRPVRLVLAGRATTLAADVRTWAPGRTVTVRGTITAPATPGTYSLGLALPDPASRLAATPAYAIRLANTGVWDARTGHNSLGSLTVAR